MPAYDLIFFKPTVPYKVIAHGDISIGTKQVTEYRGRLPTGKYLTGNITESLAITNWMAVAIRAKDGEFAGMALSGESGTTYSIEVNTNDPCNIELSPWSNYKWSADKKTTLNDYVIAVVPDTTPHLWKCTTAGRTHATTQPTWNLSGTTVDNTTTWTYVGPLVNPKALGPKIPS